MLGREFDQLRYEPLLTRVRGLVGDTALVDSRRALLVWEPRRVVPTYAVPLADVRGEVVPGTSTAGTASGIGFALPDLTSLRALDPRVPFAVRDGSGQSVLLGGSVAGFLSDDPSLDGYVVVDFDGFDRCYEEDEEVVGHPRDPFHRVDVRPSSRQVETSLEGVPLVASGQPLLVTETMLPLRWYVRPGDVLAELLPSETRTFCAYKGQASYFSVQVGGRLVPDLAWTYPEPLPGAERLAGRIAFFDERLDLVLDGEPQPRLITPWS